MTKSDWDSSLSKMKFWFLCPNSSRHGYMQQDPNGTIVCLTCWKPRTKRSRSK